MSWFQCRRRASRATYSASPLVSRGSARKQITRTVRRMGGTRRPARLPPSEITATGAKPDSHQVRSPRGLAVARDPRRARRRRRLGSGDRSGTRRRAGPWRRRTPRSSTTPTTSTRRRTVEGTRPYGPDDDLAGVRISLEPGEALGKLLEADGLGHHRHGVEPVAVEGVEGVGEVLAPVVDGEADVELLRRCPRRGRSRRSGDRCPPPRPVRPPPPSRAPVR